METKRPMRVEHEQADGRDYIEIYPPFKPAYLYGDWPLEESVTEFESAVLALWAGFYEALRYADTFGAAGVILHSNVEGAADQFSKECDERMEEPKKDVKE